MYLGIALLRLNKFDEAEKDLLVATQANAAQLEHGQLLSWGTLLEKAGLPARS